MNVSGEYVELSAADLAHRWRERTVLESAAEAVEYAIRDGWGDYVTPEAAMRHLLVLAWSDLGQACQRAINGKWSMECDGQVSRIVGLTHLVGPLSWEHVNVDLILNGVYEKVHKMMGQPTPLSKADRARAQAVMDRRTR